MDNVSSYVYRDRCNFLVDSYSNNEISSALDRLNYYNKLDRKFLPCNWKEVDRIERSSSMYYYDLREYVRLFPRKFRISYIFGDVTEIPSTPSIVKSRPINGDNSNSVIMNLDKFRHYYTVKDRLDFHAKLPRAVWRGRNNNIKRRKLVDSFHDHPLCDVGFVNGDLPENYIKPWLSLRQQLQ